MPVFDETYARIGVSFDKICTKTALTSERGKGARGLRKGHFLPQGHDNSVWADLTADGLDQKLLLRTDGTSVYMTQDIGTAKLRFQTYPI